MEALAQVESPDFGEDKKGEYFVVDDSSTSIEAVDLVDRICYITRMHIRITCPHGGYSACTPIQQDIELERNYVEKIQDS